MSDPCTCGFPEAPPALHGEFCPKYTVAPAEMVTISKLLLARLSKPHGIWTEDGECVWCGYIEDDDVVHLPTCPWLEAHQVLEASG